MRNMSGKTEGRPGLMRNMSFSKNGESRPGLMRGMSFSKRGENKDGRPGLMRNMSFSKRGENQGSQRGLLRSLSKNENGGGMPSLVANMSGSVSTSSRRLLDAMESSSKAVMESSTRMLGGMSSSSAAPGIKRTQSGGALTSMRVAAMNSMRTVTGGRRRLTTKSASGVASDEPMNIFASDMVSTDFILERIEEVKANTQVVKMEIEDLIISSHSGVLLPEVKSLLMAGDREWISVSFVDSLPADQFKAWQGMRKELMADFDDIFGTEDDTKIAVDSAVITVEANVEFAPGTSHKAFVSLMRSIRRQRGVCSVEFAGALFGYSEESMVNGLDKCIDQDNNLSEMVSIRVACGWRVEDSWSKQLDACIRAAKDLSDYRKCLGAGEEAPPPVRRVRSAGVSLDMLKDSTDQPSANRSRREGKRSSSARSLTSLMEFADSAPARRKPRSKRNLFDDVPNQGIEAGQPDLRRRSGSMRRRPVEDGEAIPSGRPGVSRHKSGPIVRRRTSNESTSPVRRGVSRNKSGPIVRRRASNEDGSPVRPALRRNKSATPKRPENGEPFGRRRSEDHSPKRERAESVTRRRSADHSPMASIRRVPRRLSNKSLNDESTSQGSTAEEPTVGNDNRHIPSPVDGSRRGLADSATSHGSALSEEEKVASVVGGGSKKTLINRFVGNLKASNEVGSASQSLMKSLAANSKQLDESGPDFQWTKHTVSMDDSVLGMSTRSQNLDASCGGSIDDSAIDYSCMDASNVSFLGGKKHDMDGSLAETDTLSGLRNTKPGGKPSMGLSHIFNDSNTFGMSHVFNDSMVGGGNDSCVFDTLARVTPTSDAKEKASDKRMERRKKRKEKKEERIMEEVAEEEEETETTSDTSESDASKSDSDSDSDSDSSKEEDPPQYYDWTLKKHVSKPRSQSAKALPNGFEGWDNKERMRRVSRASSSKSLKSLKSQSHGDLRRRVSSSRSLGAKSPTLLAMANLARSTSEGKREVKATSAAKALMASVDSTAMRRTRKEKSKAPRHCSIHMVSGENAFVEILPGLRRLKTDGNAGNAEKIRRQQSNDDDMVPRHLRRRMTSEAIKIPKA